MSWEVREGDVRTLLRGLEAESVQCVATSPPYWGLRAYGTEPQVWGGDEGHVHKFMMERKATELGSGNWAQGTNGRGELQPGGVDVKREPMRATSEMGLCACGAWRGELGLEPSPWLYLEHALEVFREVHRVLRKDGTLWLNMGDS